MTAQHQNAYQLTATGCEASLQAQILALGLLNPVSQCDVDADDIAAYREDMSALDMPLSLEGFKEWLAGSLAF